MAYTPIVFEVMIHHIEADAGIASLLQHQLRKDGIRAGVADLNATKTAAARIARHSVCLVGATFREDVLAAAPLDQFDFVFNALSIKASASDIKTCSSYGTLLKQLPDGREVGLISSSGLRRTTCASYEAIAGQFTDVWFDTVPGEAIETFLEHLPRGATILDAGCGPGHHSKFLKKAGFDPVGLDFSRSMIAIAAAKNVHIPFELGDILSHSLPQAYFDGVWSAVMLNHIPSEDLPLALENLASTLKWGGVIGLNFQVGRQSEIVACGHDHRFFDYPPDEDRIGQLLAALGFRIVATQIGTTSKNIHGLSLEMRFATIVTRKLAFT